MYTDGKQLFNNSWAVQGYPKHQTAESILALSFLKAKGVPRDLWDNKETFMKNYDIINIENLGEYVACWKHGNTTYSSNSNRFNWSVKTMGDF